MGEEIPNAQVFAPLFRRCAHPHESAYLHDVSCQYLEISGNLQNPRNFGYTFNAMGHLTAVSENTNLNNYAAAVTNDANGNITQVTETWNGQFPLASTLAYDYENRLTQHATGMLGITVAHKYDGLGRLVRTDRTTAGPTTTQFEHVRDGLKLVGNIDATNTNTAPTWTNKPGALRPVESQQVVTNSATQYINVSDEISPARRTYNPSTSAAGDTEAIAAKGRLVLVNGSTPALAASLAVNPSELFSQRNMTYNENSIALPSDRGTLEISGANLMYEGARVKSWMLGRDVNPAGRGDGAYYAQGAFNLWGLRPVCTPQAPSGFGNSVNNGTKCDSSGGACKCALLQDPLSRCACQVDELCSQCHNMIFQCGSSLPDWPVDANGNLLPLKEALKDPSFAQAYCGYLRGNCICLEEQGSPPCSPYNAWFCCFEFCHSGDMGGGTGPGGVGGGGGFHGGCTSCGRGGRFVPGGPMQGGGQGGGPAQGAPPASQNINVNCHQVWEPYIRTALNLVLRAVAGGCIGECSTGLNSRPSIKSCILDLLQNGGFTIQCRWHKSQGRAGLSTHNVITIWLSALRYVCGAIGVYDIAAVLLHELVHMCQIRNGPQSSCCDTFASVWVAGSFEALAYRCQYECFPNTCITRHNLQMRPNIPNEPSCCSRCE